MRRVGVVSTPYIDPAAYAFAWVNFTSTNGTINGARNVASLVDNGVGDYSVNFTNPAQNASYAVSFLGRYDGSAAAGVVAYKNATAPATTSFTVSMVEGSGETIVDFARVFAVVYAHAGPVPARIDEALLCSTWVNFTNAGAVQDHENVASITDNGTGDWTVNFARPYRASDSYAIGGGTKEANACYLAVAANATIGSTSVQLHTGGATGGRTDPDRVYFAAWGEY